MKKALVFIALLAAACVADAAFTSSASSGITLDARRRTVDVSLDITLNTKIPLGTTILVK